MHIDVGVLDVVVVLADVEYEEYRRLSRLPAALGATTGSISRVYHTSRS